MSHETNRLVMVDGRDALAYVIIRPGEAEGTVALEAQAKGFNRDNAARVLRHVADAWAPAPGYTRVLEEVAAERVRQDERWGEQNHPDGTGSKTQQDTARLCRQACQEAAERGEVTWELISGEEHAEAMAESDPVKLRAELIQDIAVKVAWVEALDRRTGGGIQQLLEVAADQLPADDPDRDEPDGGEQS